MNNSLTEYICTMLDEGRDIDTISLISGINQIDLLLMIMKGKNLLSLGGKKTAQQNRLLMIFEAWRNGVIKSRNGQS